MQSKNGDSLFKSGLPERLMQLEKIVTAIKSVSFVLKGIYFKRLKKDLPLELYSPEKFFIKKAA